MTWKIFLFTTIFFCVLTSFKLPLDKFSLLSPDGKVQLNMLLVKHKLNYRVNWSGHEVVGLSELAIFSAADIRVLNSTVTESNTTWSPVWGQFSSIKDHYRQLELDIISNGVKGKFYARAYDGGVAFRFQLQQSDQPKTVNLSCFYTLPKGSSYYASNGESEPLGPLNIHDLHRYQSIGEKSGEKKNIPVPLVAETPNKIFVALLESDLFTATGFKNMSLGVDGAGAAIVSINTAELLKNQLITPWRVILLGKSAGDLVVNTMTQNLASPCKLKNTDWIKPGKALWDWRVHGYTAADGFKYDINTESYIRFIDFAAKHGIEYFLIDDSWYTKVTKGHFELFEKLDLQKVIEHAREKNVALILYYDNKQGTYGDDALFPYYQSMGMKGIKYGFMGQNVPFTVDAIQKCADSKLLIDFHDSPVPMTGVDRTYPNAITREYCHAQQDSRRVFTPEAFIKMALINAITGPLDMNNGNFDLAGINAGEREKGPKKLNSYLSTVTSEAARTLIIFSGLVCIPDAPEAYQAKADLFEFIKKQPVGKWDESKILNSKIGEYITTARRYGNEWFVGSVINQKGGMLDINLDFLNENQTYQVTFYEDADNTDCKTNPEAYQVRKAVVRKGEFIKAKLAPGGGHCMWITPLLNEAAFNWIQ